MRLSRWLPILVALVTGAIAVLAAVRWWELSRLRFNEAGRAFDPNTGVVSHQSGVLGWGTVAIACGAVCFVALKAWLKSRQVRPGNSPP